MLTHTPVSHSRPPDQQKSKQLPNLNPSTNSQLQNPSPIHTTVPITAEGTVDTIAQISTSTAINNYTENQPTLSRGNDSALHQTHTNQKSDNSNHTQTTTDSLKKSDELATSGAATVSVQNQQNALQIHPITQPSQFPKVSSNFDRSNAFNKLIRQNGNLDNPPGARRNAPTTVSPANAQNGASTSAPPPPTVIPTFATKLRAAQTIPTPKIQLHPVKRTTKQGLPAVIFNRDDYMVKLAANCRFTVIGKFSSNMPKMEVIRKSLNSQLQISGTIKVTHFNSRHVYIDLDNELDHSTVWHKEKIFVEGMTMRLFVWTPTFKPQEETPIAPVWVVLPEFPWHCYCMEVVTPLLEDVGRALFLDAASFQKTRGSVAKVKLELDLTKDRPKHIWMGYDEDEFGNGRWQEVQYENVPSYCSYCKHQGHPIHACNVKARAELFQKKEEEMKKNKDTPNTSADGSAESNKVKAQIPIPPENAQQREPMYQVNGGSNPLPKNITEQQKKTKNYTRGRSRGPAVKQVYVPRSDPQTGAVMSSSATVQICATDVSAPVNGKIYTQKEKTIVEPGHDAVDETGEGNMKDDLNEWHCKNPFDLLAEEGNVTVADAIHLNSLPKASDKSNPVDLFHKQTFHNSLTEGEARGQVDVAAEDEEIYHNPSGTVKMHNAATGVVSPYAPDTDTKKLSTSVAVKHKLQNNMVATVSDEREAHRCSGDHGSETLQNQKLEELKSSSVGEGTRPKSGSTKDWVLKSFPPELHHHSLNDATGVFDAAESVLHKAMSCKSVTATVCKHGTTNKKGRKKQRKKPDVVMGKSGKLTQVDQQTKEEMLKAEKMAFWDAILTKSHTQNPITDSSIKPLNVRENRVVIYVPSQDNFNPANILPLGSDNDEFESNKTLTAYVSPAHTGNTLIPTATLEVMCKQASMVRFDTEAPEVPTYFLGDLFEDSQKDQNEPSKDVKSKWNLNAPLFIPNALRQLEHQLPVEVLSQDASDLEFPTGPSDEVLLHRLDLHDIRGLLRRQNSPPQDLPQKFSSPHPGIIEDGSEYEEEDEDSTAHNDMVEARYAGLSPRVEQACKPKLIKKKRQPLEPKKKESAPKKPKRVQPTRNIKSRYSRRK